MSDLASEVHPIYEIMYHAKAGTAINQDIQIIFKSGLEQKEKRGMNMVLSK